MVASPKGLGRSQVPRDEDPRNIALAMAAAYIKDRPIFSSERAPNRYKTVTVKEQ
jgi:hypothetical protein